MSRESFLNRVKEALSSGSNDETDLCKELLINDNVNDLIERTEAIRYQSRTDWMKLYDTLTLSSRAAGWKVHRCDSYDEASDYIATLAFERNLNHIVISDQESTGRLNLEKGNLPPESEITVVKPDDQNPSFNRRRALDADIGITGVDYAIAETGTCVVSASNEVGRLVSLAPPIYLAVVDKGQVLPSLDELFTIQKKDFVDGSANSYTSLISGPSRSADIESTLVTGVHGPGEVHLLLVEED
ncbi:MAG: L-lactate dehydrogenase complex protein LldG [Chloroflexi bacterium]|jgi:L-lactate utilization protein LutC|nr:MAG: L-lactate dehydrogenase complex protein LldG [Chloroflexota bacterium]